MPFRTARRIIRRRPRRIIRRRRFVKRIPRPMRNNQFHQFKQTVSLANVSVAAGIPQFFAYTFQLSDLAQVTQFTDLFDQYRIAAVKINFIAPYNVYFSQTTPFSVPEIYTAIDNDSAVVPANITTLQEYTTCKRQPFTRQHTRYLRPKAQFAATNAAGATAIASIVPRRSPWINTFVPGVPHYALLGAIENSVATQIPAMTIRVTAQYYIQFRNVK